MPPRRDAQHRDGLGAEPSQLRGRGLLLVPWRPASLGGRRGSRPNRNSRRLRHLPPDSDGAVPGRQARPGMGQHERHADDALAADGSDRGDEGLRRLSPHRAQDRRGDSAVEGRRRHVRPGVVRHLPHAPPVLGQGGSGTPGLPDLSHGHRPPAVGNVFLVQAWRPASAQTDRDPSGTGGGPDVPDVPHAQGRPWGEDGVGFPGGAPAHAGRPGVGGRSGHHPPGPGRPGPAGQPDCPAGGS